MKTLKQVDEKLGAIAHVISEYTMLALGLDSLGKDPTPKLHTHFLEKCVSSGKDIDKKILKSIHALFGAKSKIDRDKLARSINEKLISQQRKFATLIVVRSKMQAAVQNAQARAVLHNAMKKAPAKRKQYVTKASKEFNLCEHKAIANAIA